MNIQRIKFWHRRLIVNRSVQYLYLIHILIIASLVTCFNIGLSLIWHAMLDHADVQGQVSLQILVLTITVIILFGAALMAISIISTNILSNHVAGPIWRLNEQIKLAVLTNELKRVSFRQGDQFHELAESYNQLVAHLNATRGNPTQEEGSGDENV